MGPKTLCIAANPLFRIQRLPSKLQIMYPLSTTVLSIFLIASALAGCISSSPVTSAKPARTLPEIKYFADTNTDGSFERIQPAEAPEPRQGKDQWVRDFYGAMKYPPAARENGISGIVILAVSVDATGQVQEVGIKQSLTAACDNSAKQAYRQSTRQGYRPLLVDSVPVAFRMELPVGFWLE